MNAPVAGHVIVGPADHGVVLFAAELAAQEGGPVITVPSGPEMLMKDGETTFLALAGHTDLAHLQFTDALYGPNCTEAAATFRAVAQALPGPVTVTLHDLPDPDDEPGRYRRRAAAYRAVVDAVDGVAVSSRHEARLLGLLGAGVRPTRVIPLPVDAEPGGADPVDAEPGDAQPVSVVPVPERPEVGVLGFVYPGKGHAEALDELTGLGRAIAFTAIGRPADGHADLVAGLQARASAAGHDWHITGFVASSELPARLRRVAVPLAPGRQVSASGSVNTWLANGRRPLVLDGPYAREIARHRPGAIRLYRDGTLAGAVRDALADPASTWLRPGQDIGPGRAETASAYRQLFAEVTASREERVSRL